MQVQREQPIQELLEPVLERPELLGLSQERQRLPEIREQPELVLQMMEMQG